MKKLTPQSLVSLLFAMFMISTTLGQCPLLEAGDDKFACSNTNDPVQLDVLINGIPELIIPQTGTDSYRIEVPPCPLPPLVGVPIDLSMDDTFSQIQNLLFEFSYFGNSYTQFVVGANGKISFDTSFAGNFDDWNIDVGQEIPNLDGASFPFNTIFGAYHDIDPGVGGEVNFFISGAAPERALVVNYNGVPQFGCNELITNQQIILYESTNMIQVNIFNKPVCTTWNDGLAVIGIQGNDLTEFAVPPGRNTGVWDVSTAETWYFIPNGLSNTDSSFTVTDTNTGMVVATGIPAEVSPTVDTVYLVEFTFELPNGNMTTISDTVTVFVTDPPVVPGPTGPLVMCDPDNDGRALFDLTAADMDISGGDPDIDISYHGTLLDAQNDLLPLPNMYENDTDFTDVVYVRAESITTGCYVTRELTLEVRDSPVATTPAEPLRQCDDNVPDGFTFFDLTQVAAEVYGALDPTQYDLYYYANFGDADLAGMMALADPTFPGTTDVPDATNFLNTENPQTVYILMVGNDMSITSPNPNGASGCYDIVELVLIVDPLPLDLGPFSYVLCDDEQSGSTTDNLSVFDLTTQDTALTGGSLLLDVLWFETPAAELADTPILDPTMYTPPVTPFTVVGRITTEFDCSITVTLTLTVQPNPSPIVPTALEECDDDDDGIVDTFDLTTKDGEIVNGEANVSILYYETLAEAEAGDPLDAIMGLYENLNSPFSQIVYARVTANVPPNELACYTIQELELVVIALPDMPDANFQNPLISCDDDGDGDAIFDLTSQNASVYGTQNMADFAPISYYLTEMDAIADTAEIDPGSDAFESVGQTIWVRLESILTGCFRITSFELQVGTFPDIEPGNELFLCDDTVNGSTAFDGLSTFDLTLNEPVIYDGDTTLDIDYFASAADQMADTPIVDPMAYQNIIPGQQDIFFTVRNLEGCPAPGSFLITVVANPVVVANDLIEPLVVCDDGMDGFFTDPGFDLTSKDGDITTELDVTVAYYETMVDAEIGDPGDALVSPYPNINPFMQTVYARVTRDMAFPGIEACFSIAELKLVVEVIPDAPIAGFIEEMRVCDDDMDGFAEFNLRDNDPFVTGGTQIEPDFLPVSYYESEADAIAGMSPIPFPTTYVNMTTPSQMIWVRLENATTGCARVSSFEIFVDPLPVIGSGPFEQTLCDDELNGSTSTDQISTFDLVTTVNDAITLGEVTYSVFYYLTPAAQAADTPIADPTMHQNVDEFGVFANPQTLYVTIFTDQGCTATTTVTLRVLPNPDPFTPVEPLEACDDEASGSTSDGFAEFDLTSQNALIEDGEADVTTLYYETFEDATNGVAGTELTNPYTNGVPGGQTVYARVTRDVPPSELPCFSIVELVLQVNPIPDDSADISDEIDCQVPVGAQGSIVLDDKDAEVLNGQDPALFDVSYYESLADAQAMTGAIASDAPYLFDTTERTIYVGIQNIDPSLATQCYVTFIDGENDLSFILQVKEGATATAPLEPYRICDNLDASDGIGAFTLFSDVDNPTDLDAQADALGAEILNGQDPSQYTLSYHESLENATANVNPLPDVYINLTNPQIIYARVSNDIDPDDLLACFEVVEVVLLVDQLPVVLLQEEYRLCVDANGSPIQEEEGEQSPPVIDTGLDSNLFTFIWTIDGVIQPNEVDSSIAALAAGVYEVTITEIATGCTATVSTTVVISSPPLIYDAVVTTNAFDSGNHAIVATAEGEGTYIFSLDDGAFQSEGEFNDVEPGNHLVTIKDENGCGSVVIEVGIIDYPRFMTPNEDGFHDKWNIIGIANGDPTAKIYIFDKFGKLLKQLSPLGDGWDGTYNGNPLPSSDYWFRVEYKEKDTTKEFTGHFTLKR